MSDTDRVIYEKLYQDFLPDYSISYNNATCGYIEKLIIDFSNLEGYEFNLLHGDEGNRLKLSLCDKSKDSSALIQKFSDFISSYDKTVNYKEKMTPELKDFYRVYQDALLYVGQFGFGVKNLEDGQKMMVKTNIEEMAEKLKMLGYSIENGKILIENKMSKEMEDEQKPGQEVILPGESYVDLYEKIVQNKNGEDVIVRMSIIKQNKEDSNYERLVNVSYVDKQTGEIRNQEMFGYEDGYEFDKNAIPEIIDGFKKNSVTSGRSVDVFDENKEKCYVTSGDDFIYLEGYYVEDVRSIVARDKEDNLLGDANNVIDDVNINAAEIIFDYEKEKIADEDENSKEKGPILSKKLGEMPTSNSSGFVNYFNLALFLAVDVLSILIGLYLLMR